MSRTNALHAAVTFRSETLTRRIFEDLFGLSTIKEIDAGAELCSALFGIDRDARIIQYEAGDSAIEVFVDPQAALVGSTFDHICIDVLDREAFLDRAAAMGLEVRRFATGAKELIFMRDPEGHFYEVKQRA